MNENLPVAIQVYGLRDLLEETPERFEEVMCSVKEMGYQGVELAGLYGLEPGEVKRILDTAVLGSRNSGLNTSRLTVKSMAPMYVRSSCTVWSIPTRRCFRTGV